MDVNAFHTTAAATVKTDGAKTGGQALSGSPTGLFGMNGMSFLDLIFGNFGEGGQAGDGQKKGEQQASVSLLATTQASVSVPETVTVKLPEGVEPLTLGTDTNTELPADMSVEDLLAMLSDAGIPLENIQLDGKPITEAVQTQLSPEAGKNLISLLKNLTKGLPQAEGEINLGAFIKEDAADLTFDLSVPDENGEPVLIATGLNLEQLNQIMKDIKSGKKDSEALDGLMIGMAQLTQPDVKKEAIVITRNVIVPAQIKAEAPATGEVNAQTDLSAQLNALNVGEEGAEEGGFERILKVIENAKNPGGYVSNADIAAKTGTQAAGNSTAALPAAATGTSLESSLLTSAAWDSVYPDGMDWTQAPQGQAQLSITGTAALTSLAGYGGHAGQPHPATQAVAVSLSKMAQGGETKSMTLKLDPPELGRVEVRMEFDKNSKTMKALVIAEKPDTFLMLQRDSHVLERALQGTGLDVADNGLSFELSQDGALFGQNSDGRGQNHSGGGHNNPANSAEGDDVVIETVMDWNVGADGQMHYDVLV